MTAVLNTTKLAEIFIECDDFCEKLSQYLLANEFESDTSKGMMDDSEMMAIIIFYHHSGFKCFKHYHECVIQRILKSYFSRTYSYCRFVNLMKQLNFSLFAFLSACRLCCTIRGNFVDATKLVVCHNKRVSGHKVFTGIAKRGKSSTGWFWGFKL